MYRGIVAKSKARRIMKWAVPLVSLLFAVSMADLVVTHVIVSRHGAQMEWWPIMRWFYEHGGVVSVSLVKVLLTLVACSLLIWLAKRRWRLACALALLCIGLLGCVMVGNLGTL